VIQLQYICT